jgi:hypothetical protein
MGEAEPERPFYQRPWFLGLGAAAGLVATLAALIGPPKLWDVVADLISPGLPSSNTEIVFDASASMGAPFGADGTKLGAAADAVGDYVVPRANEGFALRAFGGRCDEAGELVVEFGGDHGDDVRDAAAAQQSGGAANLSNAVIAAISDFSDSDLFPDANSPKRVLIFTGGIDECEGPDAADEIRREVQRTGIDVEFGLVGMKVAKEEREQLESIQNALGERAEVVFVDNDSELETTIAALPPTGEGVTGPEGPLAP